MTIPRYRLQIIVLLAGLHSVVATARADIFFGSSSGRALIPGTEGITLQPAVDLGGWNSPSRNLQRADLSDANLTAANFRESWLDDASFRKSNLSDADLSGSRLTNVQFHDATLSDADLTDSVITGANLGYTRGLTAAQLSSTYSYKSKNLSGIRLRDQDLSGLDLSGQNLVDTNFGHSDLTGVDLTGAKVDGAAFASSYQGAVGLTPDQLYSTASYQTKHLDEIDLAYSDLTGANFHEQDLSRSNFHLADLTKADLSSANLTNASLGANLTGADLTNAVVLGARFFSSRGGGWLSVPTFGSTGFTPDQLYSTLSYQEKNLRATGFMGDLSGWNFSQQDLTAAYFGGADLTRANMSEANLTDAVFQEANLSRAYFGRAELTGADLTEATITGTHFGASLTSDQLYSTHSHYVKDLSGLNLYDADLVQWNFRDQDLTYSRFDDSDLTDADLSGANLHGALFIGSDLSGADFSGALIAGTRLGFFAWMANSRVYGNTGFTAEQLYSTQSYQDKDLRGIEIVENDLRGWDFREQNLSNAKFIRADLTDADLSNANLVNASFTHLVSGQTKLTNANLSGANLKNAYLRNALHLESAIFTPDTVYNERTQFPDGFDPVAAGLTLEPLLRGDFDGNDVLDIDDFQILDRCERSCHWWWRESLDLDGDDEIYRSDLAIWINEIKQALPGDADLNGTVDFSDFLILSENFGKTDVPFEGIDTKDASWTDGDFDLNGVVNFGDFLLLSANYGSSSQAVAAVPEPSSSILAFVGLAVLTWYRRSRAG